MLKQPDKSTGKPNPSDGDPIEVICVVLIDTEYRDDPVQSMAYTIVQSGDDAIDTIDGVKCYRKLKAEKKLLHYYGVGWTMIQTMVGHFYRMGDRLYPTTILTLSRKRQ